MTKSYCCKTEPPELMYSDEYNSSSKYSKDVIVKLKDGEFIIARFAKYADQLPYWYSENHGDTGWLEISLVDRWMPIPEFD